MLLSQFLYNNCDLTSDIRKLVEKLETEKCKLLIYTRSKDEADHFSRVIKNVGRYPDIS